jgi:hypothetical protein
MAEKKKITPQTSEEKLGPVVTGRIKYNIDCEPCIVCAGSRAVWTCTGLECTPPPNARISKETNVPADHAKVALNLATKLQNQTASRAQSNITLPLAPTSMETACNDNVAELVSTMAGTSLGNNDDAGVALITIS